MLIFVHMCLIVFLVLISFQDFKQREISWILIPLAFLALLFNASTIVSMENLIKNTLFNIAFVTLQLFLLTMYMSIKNKKAVNILREHLGLGDVLFFIVLCIAFSPVNFIVFYVISMLATLFGFIIYMLISSAKSTKEIPLAGAMASFLVIALLVNETTMRLNFYDDHFLLNIIGN